MKITLLVLASVLMLTAFASAQSPTLTAIPNTVFVGADGKFETAPDTALIQFNISAQANTGSEGPMLFICGVDAPAFPREPATVFATYFLDTTLVAGGKSRVLYHCIALAMPQTA